MAEPPRTLGGVVLVVHILGLDEDAVVIAGDVLRVPADGPSGLQATHHRALHAATVHAGVQPVSSAKGVVEAELMGVKNFGQTSLVEIREKLNEYNLDLRKIE